MKCTNPILRKVHKLFGAALIETRCGKCMSCRIHRAETWTHRLLDEYITQNGKAQFITMTYNDDKCPPFGLSKTHIQSFWKMLRPIFPETQIKYYLAAEYGGETLRPHYHTIMFGLKNEELKLYWNKTTEKWHSKTIEEVWKKGNCTADEVNKTTCRYVANYITKKPNFDLLKNFTKPFSLMSKSIGYNYAITHKNEIFKPDNKTRTREGVTVPISRTYQKWCDKKIQWAKDLTKITLDTWSEWEKTRIKNKKFKMLTDDYKWTVLMGLEQNILGKQRMKTGEKL